VVSSGGGGGGGGGFDAKFSSASTMSLGMSLIKSWGGVASIGTHNWQPQFVPPGVGETAAVRMASVGYATSQIVLQTLNPGPPTQTLSLNPRRNALSHKTRALHPEPNPERVSSVESMRTLNPKSSTLD
jgi:hypothetical protein